MDVDEKSNLEPLERLKVYAMTGGSVTVDSQRLLHMIRQIEYMEKLQVAYDETCKEFHRTVFWLLLVIGMLGLVDIIDYLRDVL